MKTSDWHLEYQLLGVPRMRELRESANYLVDEAIKQKVDAFIFAGDLANPDSGSIVLQCMEVFILCMRRLSQAGILTIAIPGNHDVVEDGTGRTTLSVMRPLQDCVELLEKPDVRFQVVGGKTRGFNLLALPYTASSHPYEPAKYVREIAAPKIREAEKKWGHKVPTLVVGHLVVPGVDRGEESGEMSRGRDVMFPREAIRALEEEGHEFLMFNGHHHVRQIKDGVHIAGALGRLRFGPDAVNAPGAWVVERPW